MVGPGHRGKAEQLHHGQVREDVLVDDIVPGEVRQLLGPHGHHCAEGGRGGGGQGYVAHPCLPYLSFSAARRTKAFHNSLHLCLMMFMYSNMHWKMLQFHFSNSVV